MAFTRKKQAVAAVALIAAAALAFHLATRPPPFADEVNASNLDLARPDALIRSSALSRLPPDLLRTPLARDVLAEDFVDYYEHNENREALLGTVKRIAYEHRLDLPDRILRAVFDEPAEVALWRDEGGRLSHFALAMTRNALARAIGLLLPLADAQIASAGALEGADAPILILEYGVRHRLAVLAKGDRVVVLSDPGMLLAARETERPENAEGAEKTRAAPPARSAAAAALIRELLDGGAKISPFARHFSLDEPLPEKTHEITLGAPVFAFDYAHFMPGLRALSLRFDAAGRWRSAAWLDAAGKSPAGATLWAALPRGAGLCAALPIAVPRAASLLEAFNAKAGDKPLPAAALQSFDGAAAACWYGNSRLYAPLFAAHLAARPDEARARTLLDMGARISRAGGAAARFEAKTGAGIWRAEVREDTVYGLRPAWGIAGDALFFSPDAALVDKALDVAARRYPAMADDFAPDAGGETLAVIDPRPLAELLRREMFAALPRAEEPDFRNAAEAWLAPRLDALARYPAQRVRLEASRSKWRPLAWEPLRPPR
ncbi:MAG: DUF2138 family protein [Candidatus Accumulibacter sp.]|jgi:uncharacterized protein YfaA (DUF2138 family)|nr:DUF2138 family protein [Accumulibacter sp.]